MKTLSTSDPAIEPSLLGPNEPWYMRWRGVFVTIFVIAVLESLTRGFGVRFDSKNGIAALGVVYSAFVGGVWPGLVSAAIAVLYTALLMQEGASLTALTSETARRLLTYIVVVPTAAAMIGILKSRADKAQRRAAEAAVERARREGSDSARAETREVVAASEARYRQFFHSNQAIKVVLDPRNGRIMEANDAALSFYGYPRERLLSMTISEINVGSHDSLKAGFDAAAQDQVRLDCEQRLASGEVRNVEAYAGPFDLGGRRLLFAIIHDVTARKHAEEALRDAEETFRMLFETSPDGVLVIDPSTQRPVEANEAMLRMLGYTVEELRELHLSDFDVNETAPEAATHVERILREGSDEFETRMQTKDGMIILATVRVATVQLRGRTYLHSVVRDITEHRTAELKLSEANQRLAFHVENSPLAVIEWDSEFRATRWSQGAERIFGWKAEEVVGKKPEDWRLAHEDDMERVQKAMQRLSDGVEARNVSINRNYTRDGEVLHCRWHNSARLDDTGKIISILSLVADVTAQERAEAALRASEATNRALLQAMPDLMLRHSRDGVYLGYSCQPGTPLLVPPEIFLGRRIDEVLPAHIAEPAMECLRRTLRLGGVQGYEYCVVRDTLMQHYEVRMVSCGADEVLALVRNITDRKRAEQETAKLVAIVENSYDFVGVTDANGNALYVNGAGLDIVGKAGADVSGMTIFDFVAPAHHTLTRSTVLPELLLKGIWRGELLFRGHGSEEEILLDCSAFTVKDQRTGEPLYLATVARDLTERKRAEAALRASKAMLEQAQSVAHIGSWASDLSIEDGELVWSEECCRIFGVSPDQFDGRISTFFRQVHPDDLERVKREASVAHRDERHFNIDHRIVRADGRIRWVHQEAEIEVDSSGRPVRLVGVCQDITERVATEERLRDADAQLRQAQKMEAIGLLASGVAHDFNNLLSAIFTHISLTRATLHENADTVSALDGLEAAAKQAEGVTRALLTFARKGTSDKRPTELGGVVRTVVQLLRATMPQNIRLVISTPAPGEPEGWMLADHTQLQQVIINLAINARDAMPEGGTMKIAVGYESEGPESLRRRPVASLVLSDTGIGMNETDMPRVFEPFFTTKGGTENSGLGLAIVHGIVKDHGGQVSVESSPGRGATFRVLFPAISPPASQITAPASRWRAMGDMVVLCVENRQVREIIATRLKRDGFTVVHCPGADTVRQALARHGREIRLTVIDADARGAGELLSDMESDAATQDARLIVLTANAPGLGGREHGERVISLRKPYQVSQLTDLISAVLTRSSETEEPAVERNAT